MLKLIGTVLLLAMSALTGTLAAEGLKSRLIALKQARKLLEDLRLMVRYEALEVTEISRRLSEDGGLDRLEFIPVLHRYMLSSFESGEMTFRQAWEKALSENRGALTAEDAELLMRAGDILGSCDCEGQMSVLTMLCAEADSLVEDAREQYRAKGRLYRALGAIAGAVIAVIAV